MNKQQITKELLELGAGWAVTPTKCILPNDPLDGRKSYHVHPDVSDPVHSRIIRFYTLVEIEGYIDARKEANENPEQGFKIMEEFWFSLG